MLADIEGDRLKPGIHAFDLTGAAHLALKIGTLVVGKTARVDLEPTVDLGVINIGDDFPPFIEKRDDGFVINGISHRVGGLNQLAKLSERALFLFGDRRACEGDEAGIGRATAIDGAQPAHVAWDA